MIPIFILLVGLILGSFIGAFTYRLERGVSISKGRSRCPSCKKVISWYDNIPVLSYFLLSGKCRRCKKKISFRYPIIEASTAILLLSIYNVVTAKESLLFGNSIFSKWQSLMGFLFWPFILFLVTLLVSIFVIDFEKKIILDKLVFTGVAVTLLLFLFFGLPFLENLLSGLLVSSFLLFLHIITKGKGMGLGDVKLAILGGLLLGPKLTLVWVFLAFVIGAFVGSFLILLKKAKLKQQVPFGPFLIFSLFVVLFFGETLLKMILFN